MLLRYADELSDLDLSTGPWPANLYQVPLSLALALSVSHCLSLSLSLSLCLS
eukprot:COSAG03_NODE_19346_length_338_cov_1.280335_2_plen_51_part_01